MSETYKYCLQFGGATPYSSSLYPRQLTGWEGGGYKDVETCPERSGHVDKGIKEGLRIHADEKGKLITLRRWA